MKTGLPATSRPSTVPSAAHAVATSPSPSRSTAWWWCVGASSQVWSVLAKLSAPDSTRPSDPAVPTRTRCRPNPQSGPECSSFPTTWGRCWCSVPPRTTLSSWIPRQMASSGTPAASAASSRASSQPSRSEFGAPVSGCARAPYRAGSTSPPPDTMSPSRSATVAAASAGSPPGGSSTGRPPLRRTAST